MQIFHYAEEEKEFHFTIGTIRWKILSFFICLFKKKKLYIIVSTKKQENA